MPVAQFLGEITCIVLFGMWYFFGYFKKDKKQGTYKDLYISNVGVFFL